ncbi:MAG TPA: ATP-binding protein [Candidatus Saccharicenans sp.]|nr:ATP-binding protein [Candidatus Saccharicenans sp.]HRV06561.1 ATP-binding protein [Candidatus Saccharicenans sp.]
MNPFYEKLGLFYLGKEVDPGTLALKPSYLLYDSKDLVTHAVCVGMTGSGKTGLCVGLLEEAGLDGIPAIIVDPKGDLGNLKLLFPDLKPEDFRPWIDEEEAGRKSLTADEYARQQAELWKKGLTEWDQDQGRIRRLLEAVDISIYTPGSQAGLPLSILKSFDVPPPAILDDPEALSENVSTTVSGLLGLLGLEADPLQSREHILLSNLLHSAWKAGQGLDLPSLIQQIQNPPLKRIGVFELDSFYPAADRFKLAMMLNNLLAAPGFESWLTGDPLDIGSLLYTPAGKPRLSIISIAHLPEAQRMFFVTLLLNQLLGWVRQQPGTSSLRAIFYMDEIFGFFPPVSEPPAKRPLLTLLKQARAFGLGLVLTTQNPVDLDYKGLANAGTWFIGRLQTEQDKNRLLQGLSGVASGLNMDQVSDQISRLKSRVFLLHNVHEDRPVLMTTRWTLSYLRGPLTRQQIMEVMKDKKSQATASGVFAAEKEIAKKIVSSTATRLNQLKPSLPPDVPELYLPVRHRVSSPANLTYHPAIAAFGQVAIYDNRLGISQVSEVANYVELTDEVMGLLWDKSLPLPYRFEALDREPAAGASFLSLPSRSLSLLKSAGNDYLDYLVRNYQLTLWKSNFFKAMSKPGESETDFRIRLTQLAREKRDEALDKLRQKYASKISRLEKQYLTAQQRLQREEEQYKEKVAQSAISAGATIFGAILGRKSYQVGRATTTARSASRAYYEKMDIKRAQEQVELTRARLEEIEKELQREADQIVSLYDPAGEQLETVALRPKKKDLALIWSGLLWLPVWHLASGNQEPGF